MNWKDIGEKIVGMGLPLLGEVVAGPVGASLGGSLAHALGIGDATPDALGMALGNPEAAGKLKQLETEQRVDLARIAAQQAQAQLVAQTAQLRSVNSTMQAEAQSKHWPQWLWRPFNGLLFAPTILAVYFVLPMMHVQGPPVPEMAWVMWGSLLGITSWHRGMVQRRAMGDTTDALGRAK